jgi:hypothetical protein
MKTQNEVAVQLKSLGYQVFVNPNNDRFAFFSDRKNIGYAQEETLGGPYSFSTVHKPNSYVGTAFGMGRGDITKENAEKCFCVAPDWASNSDRGQVQKYKSVENFLKLKQGLVEFSE